MEGGLSLLWLSSVELRFKLFDPCFVFFDDSQKRLLQIVDQRDDGIRPSPISVENLLAPDAREFLMAPSHERDYFTLSQFPEYPNICPVILAE